RAQPGIWCWQWAEIDTPKRGAAGIRCAGEFLPHGFACGVIALRAGLGGVCAWGCGVVAALDEPIPAAHEISRTYLFFHSHELNPPIKVMLNTVNTALDEQKK